MENFKKVGDIFNCKLLLEDKTEFNIQMREDGYIFATGLCKIVGKLVGNWLRLKEIKILIKDVENKLKNTDIHNRISQLIEVYKGNSSKYSQGTWIHPDLGIQLAQWCSPNFSLQVSKWIKELIITKKVELSNEKSNFEIQKEFNIIKERLEKELKEQILINNEFKNKLENRDTEIQILQDKINRCQKRQNYPDKNVIYIITNEELKKQRIFLFGKAVDLKTRLSTYNKSLEHEVIYYKSFKNMYQMNTAEMMILYKLNEYRDKTTTKERFILPDHETISTFTNVIDNALNWFSNIENITVDNISITEDKIIRNFNCKFETNTVYMLTSDIHLKKRMYIIGKSKNLNSRLSAYNKGIDHKVVYHKKCKNKEQMDIIELMILYKLDNFRERANRDRFILPLNKEISLFTNIFEEAVNWFENINENLSIIKDKETKQYDNKESKKNYREINKFRITIIDKKYRENNREKICIRAKKYRDTHKEQVSKVKKEWYYKNKDKVIERIKKNYYENKEQKIEKVKEYYLNNKLKVKQQQSITITCECGSIFRKYGLKKHLQTEKHLNFFKKF
jgi:hypothetical protein